jgi:hypothetical protein
MTEKEVKKLRNIKDRERYANDEEVRKKNAYRRSKSEAKRFVVKLGTEKDLKDLQTLLEKRLKEF